MVIGGLLGRRGILSRDKQELRVREEELLERLDAALVRTTEGGADSDLRQLRHARAQLDQLFLLVVAGEFNSGKSSFLNALLGARVLPEGVTPTTDRINLLTYGDEETEKAVEPYVVRRTYPAEALRELNVVDTPGTNAVIRRHEELTRDFIPRSDLVLFVTSADRPFTESERTFLEHIREWGKKVVVVLNKMDILEEETHRREVVDFVVRNATELLGREPEVFPVSARLALAESDARPPATRETAAGESTAQASGIEPVREYLLRTLNEEERIRLKLLNPLNIGLKLAESYDETVFQRLKTLTEDVEALDAIDRTLTSFHESVLGELDGRLARLDTLLLEMERRGAAFFEETFRIGRIRTIMDSDAVRREFERQVIGETPERIAEEAGRVVDWLVERNLELWREVERTIDRRRLEEHVDGDRAAFSYNRQALLDSIGRVAEQVVAGYDRAEESRKMANEVQGTFATTALAEAGALGIGTLVATIISGAAADVTGILLATALAVGGFYIIPHKRRLAKKRFAERVGELRERLKAALEAQTHREVEEAARRIEETVAPYRRFVETRRRELNDVRAELTTIGDGLERLRSEIERA